MAKRFSLKCAGR